jgi:hypothetical protein
MRGGSQAHLVRAADGNFYVVKTKQNAQHRRILVNEWVGAVLMRHLEIPSPQTEIIEVTAEFLAANPDFEIRTGNRITPITPGFHFGSRLPVDPDRFVIYDALPDSLLARIANPRDFLGALVFDKWTTNTDSRQAIFFRARVKDWGGAQQPASSRQALMALMLDHGFIFSGPDWTLEDSPHLGLYHSRRVYEPVTGLDSFQPWLDLVVHLDPGVLDSAFRQIPDFWLNGDREELERLLEKLWRKRTRVPHLLEDIKLGRPDLFPNWR